MPRCNSVPKMMPPCPPKLVSAMPAAVAQPVTGSSAHCYAGCRSSYYYVPAAASSVASLPAGSTYRYTVPAATVPGYAPPARVSYVATPQRTVAGQAAPRMVVKPPTSPEAEAAEPTSPEAPMRGTLTEEEERRALDAVRQLFDGRHGRVLICPPADMEEFYLELEREKCFFDRDPKRHLRYNASRKFKVAHMRADSDTRLYAGEKLKTLVDEFDSKQRIAGQIRREWELDWRASEYRAAQAAAEKEREWQKPFLLLEVVCDGKYFQFTQPCVTRLSQVPFDSCEDFLLCAAPMFIPCVLWSLEADIHFEEPFAPKLLQSPKVRCFALRLAAPPKFEGPPVLGMDMWLLGVCLPAACDTTALVASAAELFRSVPLSTVTGNRAHHIDELSSIHVEELLHWSELKINFGIIGPPNAGTSSLHRSLQELGAYFLGGADEMPLPVSWLRSEESWQWRCTAPLLPPAGWAKGLGLLRRREVNDDGEPTGLVAFRNPKIIYSSNCLRNLLFVPGLQIIAVWRDPVDWLWSSLHRIFEGFENAEEEIDRAWAIFAESTKEEDPSTLQPLQEQGGGMLELSTWRLGVPLSLGSAAPSRALWKLHKAVGQERLRVLPFKELISKQLACFDQLLLFLRLPASAGELLPANVRRRRTHADRRADAVLKNETARLQEFFRSERESAAALLACAA
eukprot:s271_g1.t4